MTRRPFARPRTVLALCLSLCVVGAAAADDGAGARGEKDATKQETAPPELTLPKLDLPKLDLPDTNDLSAGRRADEAEKGPTKVHYAIESVRHAHAFRTGRSGACEPVGALEGFRLASVPSNVEAFATCLRVKATAGVVATLDARIYDPAGREVAHASGEISFARRSNTVDYVVSWIGFPAKMLGRYEMVLRVGGETVRKVALPVEGT